MNRDRLWTWQSRYAPYLFVSPFVILFFAFMLYPLGWSILLSFYQTASARGQQRFVGLDNYRFLLGDWLFWGAPFSSYAAALRIDLIEGKASIFGVEPPVYYFEQLAAIWAGALPAMAALILLRARTSALWIVVALVIIASHTAIPHKEYRFVFPAFACLALVAAMGSADLIERMRPPGLAAHPGL